MLAGMQFDKYKTFVWKEKITYLTLQCRCLVNKIPVRRAIFMYM